MATIQWHLSDAQQQMTHIFTISYVLCPVHTSNNVKATFDFVEATFHFVAKNSNNVERVYRKISSFRQSQCCLDIVAILATMLPFL